MQYSPISTRATKAASNVAGNSTNNSKNEPKEPTLNDVMAELQAMAKQNHVNFSSINSRLAMIREVQTGFRVDLDNLNEKHNVMKDECNSTRNRVECLCATVDSLSYQVNTLKQAQLGQNVIISGCPSDCKMTTDHIAKIARLLDFKSHLTILEVKQIKTKKATIAKVVFLTKEMRDEFLSARRGKSIFADEIGLAKEHQQLFMQEDLTPINQNLLFQARKLKNFGFTGSWARDGQIKVRHQMTEKIITIKSELQIKALMETHKEM